MGKEKMIAKEIDLNSSESGSDGESNAMAHNREDSYINNGEAQSFKRRRYTPHQIHEMEAAFEVCSYPGDEQRRELGRKIGLEPLQVKLWYQNKRNQMKFEHQENIQLQTTNERLRAANKRYREALCAAAACTACGRPLGAEEMSREEYQLETENARLRAKIGLIMRVAMFIGMPFPPP